MSTLTKSQSGKYQDGYEDGELSSLDTVKMMTEVIICLLIIAAIFDL